MSGLDRTAVKTMCLCSLKGCGPWGACCLSWVTQEMGQGTLNYSTKGCWHVMTCRHFSVLLRPYPEVNKIQRLGRILDDKVEVFDDLQRRMEELNANARMLWCHKTLEKQMHFPPCFGHIGTWFGRSMKDEGHAGKTCLHVDDSGVLCSSKISLAAAVCRKVLGSQFATSVRCLCCKDDDALALSASRQRSTSPPRTAWDGWVFLGGWTRENLGQRDLKLQTNFPTNVMIELVLALSSGHWRESKMGQRVLQRAL